jgi:hypothetical protein
VLELDILEEMKKREGKKVKGSTHVRTIRRIPNCEPPQKKTSHKMSPASFRCCYCKRANVSWSLRGLKSHVSQTPECRARRDEEHAMLKRNRGVQIDSRDTSMPPVGHHAWEENMEGNNTLPSSDVDERPSKRARVDDDEGDDSDCDFRPTGADFIVDYPVEACAGAVFDGQRDGLEARFERIQREQ